MPLVEARTATTAAPGRGPRVPSAWLEHQIEEHRAALTGHCSRILGSSFDAEDAVQDTLVRAWRGLDRFEGRAPVRTWLYRIATNVCVDMLKGQARRPRPAGLGAEPANGGALDRLVAPDGDPADLAAARESTRLALAAALRVLRPRQRAALILCEVLRWRAAEAAELLGTSVASVNSALQRARRALATAAAASDDGPPPGRADRELLARYMAAFERHDMVALTSLVREDATAGQPARGRRTSAIASARRPMPRRIAGSAVAP